MQNDEKSKVQIAEEIKNLQLHVANFQKTEVECERAKQALHEHEDHFRTIVENINVGIYRSAFGPQGRFLQVNPAIVQMFGYDSVEEFLEISAPSLYRDPEQRRLFVEKIKKQGFVKDETLQLCKKDGTSIWGSVSAKLHYDADGNPDWIDGMIEDISERRTSEAELKKAKENLEKQAWGLKKTSESIKLLYKELEQKNEALEKFDQLKSDFVSTVSHELRTPLAIIREGASQVNERILGDINEKQSEILTDVVDNIDRLTKIVNNILDISKLESGKIALEKHDINTDSFIRRTVDDFQGKAKQKNIALQVAVAQETPHLYGDYDKLVQVMTNLLGNAIKFTPEQGTVIIDAKDDGDFVQISVADTGRGIDKENIPKLFDKFRQFGRMSEPGDKGTGLGLTIAKNIVELHGGSIWAESEATKGATFFFTVPKYKKSEIMCAQMVDEALSLLRHKGEEEILSVIIVRLSTLHTMREFLGKKVYQDIVSFVMKGIRESLTRTGDIVTVCCFAKIMVLLPLTDKKGAATICDKIRTMIKSKKITHKGKQLTVEAQFGVASWRGVGGTGKAILESAEAHLLTKKKILIVGPDSHIVHTLAQRLKAYDRLECMQSSRGTEAAGRAKKELPDLIICDVTMSKMNGYEVVGHLKGERETRDIPIIILTSLPAKSEEIKSLLPGSVAAVSKTDGLKALPELVNKLLLA